MKSTRTCKNIDKTLRSNILKLQAFGAVAAFSTGAVTGQFSELQSLRVALRSHFLFRGDLDSLRDSFEDRMGARVFLVSTRPLSGQMAPQNTRVTCGSFLAAKGLPVMYVA